MNNVEIEQVEVTKLFCVTLDCKLSWAKSIIKCCSALTALSTRQVLDVHQSTVRQIVYKWRKISTVTTLPRSGHTAKMTARAQRRMLNEVKKYPRMSAKDLQ